MILSKRVDLVRLGHGVFAKARISSLSGKPVPREPLEVLAEETLRRLHIDAQPGQAQRDYASAKSTHVPGAVNLQYGLSSNQPQVNTR